MGGEWKRVGSARLLLSVTAEEPPQARVHIKVYFCDHTAGVLSGGSCPLSRLPRVRQVPPAAQGLGGVSVLRGGEGRCAPLRTNAGGGGNHLATVAVTLGAAPSPNATCYWLLSRRLVSRLPPPPPSPLPPVQLILEAPRTPLSPPPPQSPGRSASAAATASADAAGNASRSSKLRSVVRRSYEGGTASMVGRGRGRGVSERADGVPDRLLAPAFAAATLRVYAGRRG